MAGSRFANFLSAKASIHKSDCTCGILACSCSIRAQLLASGVAVPPPRVIMVSVLTGGGITFCKFSFSQSFNSQNRLHLLGPCVFLLHSNTSASVWSCRSTSADSYGMRLDRWRDHVLQIFSQPRLQFTKPIARDESSRVPAPFEQLCVRLELPFHLRG